MWINTAAGRVNQAAAAGTLEQQRQLAVRDSLAEASATGSSTLPLPMQAARQSSPDRDGDGRDTENHDPNALEATAILQATEHGAMAAAMPNDSPFDAEGHLDVRV